MNSSKKVPLKSKGTVKGVEKKVPVSKVVPAKTASVKKTVSAKPFTIEKKALLKNSKIDKKECSIELNPKIETAEGWKRKAFKARDEKKK